MTTMNTQATAATQATVDTQASGDATTATTTDANLDQRLSADVHMDAVTLQVGDLENMSSYYSEALSLEPIEERARGRQTQRLLGRGRTPMIRLIHTPELPAGSRHSAGLYHTAFLFDTPRSLAATVYRAAQDPQSRYVGSADHLVSEAFYFTDPEGNGIELYTDRDRSAWKYTNGEVQMDTLYLDPNQYLREHLAENPLDARPVDAGQVGHVHLQVGDLHEAQKFYVDLIGFDVTVSSYPGALFASAGGYHHHLGMNTWQSAGAGPRAASLGLGEVAITVPSRDDLDALVARLKRAKLAFADDGHAIVVKDPWGTQVRVGLPDTDIDNLLSR